MIITVKNRINAQLKSDFKQWKDVVIANLDKEDRGYGDIEIDLMKLTERECQAMVDLLAKSNIQGTKVLAADVKKYLRAAKDGLDDIRARTVRQAAWMVERHVCDLPNHLVFAGDNYDGGSHVGYYIDDVEYVPERHSHRSDRMEPEHVRIHLVYIEDDCRCSTERNLEEADVLGKTADEILRAADLRPETPALVDKLRAETKLYYAMRERIGKKYTARGIGVADLDDAAESERYAWYSSDRIRLDNFGETPVVVDVLHESDKEQSKRDSHCSVKLYRWHPWNMRYFAPSEDDLARHLAADENTDFQPQLELPVHPLVPCFDFRRHKRLRVHVNNLTEYKYRRDVADGLVLPERDKRLIDMLVDQSTNQFQDVVENKGQSLNVLLGGSPGTGKTLTAEIYSEYKERPLYSVQCSQLGLRPDDIESKLSIILRRANRWNAVLLLDEADVYIRERGDDLEHNAIVGVFLRMLEYAQCILFMTTNRADIVDDAISSRCIVAIRYEVPEPEAQLKIWRNLAEINKLALAPGAIEQFVEDHPHISGRDVKNLLKLASFVAKGRAITINDLSFALSYKPTADAEPTR